MIELQKIFSADEIKRTPQWKEMFSKAPIQVTEKAVLRQTLTHQKIEAVFFEIHLPREEKFLFSTAQRIPFSKISEYPFPGVIREFLANHFFTSAPAALEV
jgi:hypothetical protein